MSLSGLLPLIENLEPFRRLVASLSMGRVQTVVVEDVLEAAKPYFWASLQARLRQPIIIITARPDRAVQLLEEMRAYSVDPASAMHWPADDALPYEQLATDTSARPQRLYVLARVGGKRAGDQNADDSSLPPLVVTSIKGLMQPTLSPDEFYGSTLTLKVGQKVDLQRALEHWVALGYGPERVVEEPGTISRRGGIIDIYPPASPRPVRLELWGDEIESLRFFDPSTQRSERQVIEVVVTAPSELAFWRRENALQDLARLDLTTCRPEVREQWEQHFLQIGEGRRFEGMELLAPYFDSGLASLLDHASAHSLVVLDEPEQIKLAAGELEAQAEDLRRELVEQGELPPALTRPYLTWPELALSLGNHRRLSMGRDSGNGAAKERFEAHRFFSSLNTFGGQIKRVIDEVEGLLKEKQRVIVVSQQARRLGELFEERDIFPTVRKEPRKRTTPIAGESKGDSGESKGLQDSLTSAPSPSSLHLLQGNLAEGWRSAEMQVVLFTDTEIFGWAKPPRRPVRRKTVRPDYWLNELNYGDYVVHIEHGIARYDGLVKMGGGGQEREYLLLQYAASDRLYVPIDQVERVSPYIGGGPPPALSRLGTADWSRVKKKVKESVQSLARELLDLYSAREIVPGHAYSPDSPWQRELEESFPYVETEDQLQAIADVKKDMEQTKPMDRLICGDVGYGKTEVALRAAFKAVMDSRQVAILVPTTILAQQHYNTFTQRLQAFPVRVEMLSRFRSKKEQERILADLSLGKVDIVVGTHRLLQKDVVFKDLGLLIVDEEQRFGVRHKEQLKQLRREVDVLTLSATPIPRTLHMSLVGVRDMSVIETPPEERLPVKTYVTGFDERLLREVVLREMDRGGQVFFVHNRVETIQAAATHLRRLVPEARLAVGHGQLDERELEKVMLDFVNHQYDVLVCTTIIESGLDIPNVNTLVVSHAGRFGLAQLYQLRGRVGRGANRAYAYFFYSPAGRMTETAQKRLQTIQQLTELGAGFRIALKDLEIRGAGNLLGPEQHGHVVAIGFDLYTRLLAQAVDEVKGKPVAPEPPAVTLDLPLDAYLPQDYIEDDALRLRIYQRLARSLSLREINDMSKELEDRFGALPLPAKNLGYLLQLKSIATRAGVQAISAADGEIIIKLPSTVKLHARQFERRFADIMRLTPNQVRLNFRRLGERWTERLRVILEELENTLVEEPAPGSPGSGGSKTSYKVKTS